MQAIAVRCFKEVLSLLYGSPDRPRLGFSVDEIHILNGLPNPGPYIRLLGLKRSGTSYKRIESINGICTEANNFESPNPGIDCVTVFDGMIISCENKSKISRPRGYRVGLG